METLSLGVAVAMALVVIFGTWMLWRWQWSKYENLPPGPRPFPIFGSLHLLGTQPHRSLAKLASQYGPLMSIWLGQRLYIVASTAEGAKEFLKLQDANFAFRPSIQSADILLPHDIAMHNVTPELRHLRKILVSELMSPKRLESSQDIRDEETARSLGLIAAESGPSRVRTHLNVTTTNIVSRMVFNKRFLGGDDQDGGRKVVKEFQELVNQQIACFSAIFIGDFFNVPKWFDPQGLKKQCWKVRASMDRFYARMVDEYKEEQKRKPSIEAKKTLYDTLCELLEFPENGITEEHIECLIYDFFAAGTETTVLTIEWAIAEVLHNPLVLMNARSELDCVVGQNRTVQESDVPDLQYIQAIVKETLRLHTPAPLLVPHQSKEATQAFGYDIPAQTRLFVNAWAIGRDNWEKPLEFVPERFLKGGASVAMEFQGQHYDFLPFGTGKRMCPAMGLASLVVNFQVASLLHAFDWETEGLELEEGPVAITLWKQHPLIATAKPRLPLHLYQG